MSTTTEKAPEKKVLFFNEKAHEKQKADVQDFIDSLNRFGELLQEFDLKLTPEFLSEFMEKDYPLISDRAVEAYLTREQGNRFLADQVRHNANREANKFRNFRRSFSDHILKTRIPVEQIPIKDGKAYLSPEMEKDLRENNTVTLDPKRKTQFDIIQQFCDSFNAFREYCIKNNMSEPRTELKEVFSEPFYIMDELIQTGNYLIPDKEGEKLKVNPYYFK